MSSDPNTGMAAARAPSPPALPGWATMTVASCNLLNLARAGRVFYANQDPYDAGEAERKLAWTGALLARLNADVVAAQEVWDLSAWRDAVERSGLRYPTVIAPGTETGAEGTPRVGLATRLAVESVESIAAFPAGCAVPVPELGEVGRFERPILKVRLRTRQGRELHVITAHLKSKRPKILQDAAGEPLEDRDDPAVIARASLRSLVLRGAEAAALRRIVIGVLHRTREPLVLMGDLNDGPQSVTSQLVAALTPAAYDRDARDVALHHAWDVATEPALRRDLAYSHVHQGWPDLLDQIWVSEEFVAGSKHALGDVRRVEVFNDHLHEGRDRTRSDHGFVRALLRWRLPAP
jgi:endonuclease/exonuclease/phosphatase family metal-dependent hydrolase